MLWKRKVPVGVMLLTLLFSPLDVVANSIPDCAMIKTKVIAQNPELPTGCESVALTMALQSLGYKLEKTEIADQYMNYNWEEFVSGYMGDPHSENGAGIFPPGLVTTANRYLKSHVKEGHDYHAKNISGTEFENLFLCIAKSQPVLIWVTSDLEEVESSDIEVEYEGEEYKWYQDEHCVMLGGYDLENDSVLLYDSIHGRVRRPIEDIKSIYDDAGQYAVVIY